MSVRLALIGIAGVLFAAAAPAQRQAQADEPPADAKALIDSCAAHRFETIVSDVTADGQPKKSRVKLCGKPGQTDAEWIATLKDALDKVAANEGMSASAKAQVMTALNAEIRRLDQPLPQGPASRFNLGRSAPPPTRPVASPPPEYTSLPPLPAPKPAVVAATGTAAVLPMLARPDLKIECYAPGQIGGPGPCTDLEREMFLMVKAGEDIPAGTSLRFLRRGEDRASIDLAQLRKGKSLQAKLPQAVCQGVGGSSVQIDIVRKPPGAAASEQVVDSMGPFELRC
jgi:hypothetical protein